MTNEHQRYVRVETGISVILNAVVSALFVWLVFGGQVSIGLWGRQGLAFDLVPTTFMITLMTCVALTLLTRARVRKGRIAPMVAQEKRIRLPRVAVLRGLALALLATLLLVPASVAVLAALWDGPWSFAATMLFKVAYGAVLGLLVTPPILRAALRDGAGRSGQALARSA